MSEIVRTGSERSLTSTWETTLPVFGSLGNVGWHTDQFGHMIKAIEPKPSDKMESMDIEEVYRKPVERAPFRQKNEDKVPTLELNGMTLSTNERSGKPLIRASTFGIYSKTGATLNTTKQPAVRSRSASPKKFADRSSANDHDNTEALNLNETVVQKLDYNATKKKLRSLIPEEKIQPKNSRYSCSCSKFLFYLLLSFAAAILAIIIYDEDLARNQRGLDIKNMSLELAERVYGQDRAIGELTKDLRKSSDGINFVALVGGTGVGKSYTVGIVRKHFPHVDSVFEYFPPIEKTVHEAFGVLSRRHCSLIILENLNTEDLRDAMIFVKFLRGQKDQYCVYTIAVFNPQKKDEDFSIKLDLKRSVKEISEALKKNGLADSPVIGFDELDDRSLDACIRKAADEYDVRITDEQLTDIRRRLLTANSGCKGAYAKVQLLANS